MPSPKLLFINIIYNTTLHTNIKCWFANYLTGRQAFTHVRRVSFTNKNFRKEVSQGSALSYTFFNLYMHDILTAPNNIYISSYASDLSYFCTQMQIYVLHNYKLT